MAGHHGMKFRREVFDTYWKFAAERQEIFFKKLGNQPPPYSADPILQTYKFCNTYRASDRVSQFLVRNVIYKTKTSEEDQIFRIFLFRLLNKIETWRGLEDELGIISLSGFSFSRYSKALVKVKNKNKVIYGNAFILCANKAYGFDLKHENHLALLEEVFRKKKYVEQLVKTHSLEDLFNRLKTLPLIGNFMAYQLAIDFNYSEVFNFDENDFTEAGPGAIRGIRKCFASLSDQTYQSVIRYMVENQDSEFKRLGIKFKNLWGRPLQAIDCQGLFCEVDKYSRVKFPLLRSNRVRIKANYVPTDNRISYFYPPKWGINRFITQS